MGLDHFYRIESIDDNKRYLLVESWIKIPLFLPTFIYLFSTISLLVMRIRCQGALIVFLPPAAGHRTKPLPKKLGKKVAKKKKTNDPWESRKRQIQMRCGVSWSICLDSAQLAISERKSPMRDQNASPSARIPLSCSFWPSEATWPTTWLPDDRVQVACWVINDTNPEVSSPTSYSTLLIK